MSTPKQMKRQAKKGAKKKTKSSQPKPELTVGIPSIYGEKVAWIGLEGLIRQKDAPPWELIFIEEAGAEFKPFGVPRLQEYHERLFAANCVNVKYLECKEKTVLWQKWYTISQLAADTRFILMQGSDDISEPHRLADTMAAPEDTEWYQVEKGIFWDAVSENLCLYDITQKNNTDIGVNCAFRTADAKKIPQLNVRDGMEGKIRSRIMSDLGKTGLVTTTAPPRAWQSVYTDGFNVASNMRSGMYTDNRQGFYPLEGKLDDFLDAELVAKLRELRPVAVQRRVEHIARAVSNFRGMFGSWDMYMRHLEDSIKTLSEEEK